jgi:hypothetical protein
LINDGFIDKNTDKNGFIWAFGGSNNKYTSFKISWLKNIQLLRELLKGIQPFTDLIMADIERLCPMLFEDKKGNPINLAKNKVIQSLDCDKMTEILNKIATV